MKALILAAALCLMQPCFASTYGPPTTEGMIAGITRVESHWHLKPFPHRTTTYTYQTDNNETFLFTKKIKGVKDLRPYAEIHPLRHWLIVVCERWQPVANLGASVAIPAMQTLNGAKLR